VKILVTGSSGHLGEALVGVLGSRGDEVIGLDQLESPLTNVVGSIADRECVQRCVKGVDAIIHTATLHKPHVGSHSKEDFVETNITGTLNLLEEAVAAGIDRFVFVSTTSTYGKKLTPAPGEPAAWITEDVVPAPRNIYGATKVAAEGLCELIAQERELNCIVLRTSRFFPEPDDRPEIRETYPDLNIKVNELLYRRVDIEDVVSAALLAVDRAPTIGFARYVISATTPFKTSDLVELHTDAPAVVRRLFPESDMIFELAGWKMFPSIERVYVNDLARQDLGWSPRYDFGYALERIKAGTDPRSDLAIAVGAKGYHAGSNFPYTVR